MRLLSPMRGSVLFMPGVGPKRSERLNEAGVHTLDELLDAPPEVIRSARLSIRKVEAFKEALATDLPVWIKHKQIEFPEPALFYDVETGLGLTSPDQWMSEPKHPWLIGAMVGGTKKVHQWVALDERDNTSRRAMYMGFVDLVRALPNHTLCSWSGTGFDSSAISEGLGRYLPSRVKWWEERMEIDILRSGLRRRVVFPCPN